MSNIPGKLNDIYRALLSAYGPQAWWPADSDTEIVIGTVLVQHTAWANVTRAIENLKRENLLHLRTIAGVPETRLAEVIRPAGTPTVKARRLRALAQWFGRRYDFDLEAAWSTPTSELRSGLLEIRGVGPETADCILLYAARHATFVVDAYTRRILTRHLLADAHWGQATLKGFLESNVEQDVALFNEFHALLVEVGKRHCRRRPVCAGCPLEHLEHRVDA